MSSSDILFSEIDSRIFSTLITALDYEGVCVTHFIITADLYREFKTGPLFFKMTEKASEEDKYGSEVDCMMYGAQVFSDIKRVHKMFQFDAIYALHCPETVLRLEDLFKKTSHSVRACKVK